MIFGHLASLANLLRSKFSAWMYNYYQHIATLDISSDFSFIIKAKLPN